MVVLLSFNFYQVRRRLFILSMPFIFTYNIYFFFIQTLTFLVTFLYYDIASAFEKCNIICVFLLLLSGFNKKKVSHVTTKLFSLSPVLTIPYQNIWDPVLITISHYYHIELHLYYLYFYIQRQTK